MLRLRHVLALAAVSAAVLPACEEKKPAPAPAPSAAPSAKPAASPTAAASAAAPKDEPKKAGPAKKVALRELIWTEKTPAETKYVDCMVKACLPVYKECYGDKVEQGEFSGPCGDYGKCVAKCAEQGDDKKVAACGADCLDKHKKEGSACDTCGDKVGACSEKGKCTPPIEMPR